MSVLLCLNSLVGATPTKAPNMSNLSTINVRMSPTYMA